MRWVILNLITDHIEITILYKLLIMLLIIVIYLLLYLNIFFS
jgi:hypothetical protein